VEKSLTMSLFDPMMTNFHRIGLAGLFMSLQQLGKSGGVEGGTWELSDVGVTLRWEDKPREFFEKLLSGSFRVSKDGLVDFAGHRSRVMGTAEKTLLQQALFDTFLNHTSTNHVPKGTREVAVSVQIEEKNPVFRYKPLVKPFAHSEAAKDLFTGSGHTLKESIPIKKWLLPGAVQRHSEIASTCLEESPERYLCLLFAPMACLYYRLSLLARDGKRDKRKRAAVVIPHITNLRTYADAFQRYLVSPMGRLSASGLADAGLSALLCLKAEESMDTLGITGFSVITYGKVPWDKNQTPRTGSIDFEDVRQSECDPISSGPREVDHPMTSAFQP
jgi:CRISPR-associated protein Cas8a1/Csx13